MTNVDSVEVSRFEDLASQWWDPEGDFKSLHQINPLRLEYIDRRFPLDGQNVLDLGCGGGLLAESMSDRGASVRIPMDTSKAGKGYLEDRRPAANMDPYQVCSAIITTVCGNSGKTEEDEPEIMAEAVS